MTNTYIVKFGSFDPRNRFFKAIRARPDWAHLELAVGEFLPDVIVRGVSPPLLAKLKGLAPEARFIEDFSHSSTAREGCARGRI